MDLLSESIKGRLLLAIPKKGRLYEKCIELLAGADIQYNRSHRLDVCLVRNHNIALIFLPAADIPRFVGLGNVDLGITGQDVIVEAGMGERIREVLPLAFGKCKLQIQVPERGPVKSVKDLAGKRIVTSFDRIAKTYFDKVDAEAGLQAKTQIEYVGGSVEAACALGLADGIVDLVESGETMRAAGLHAIETIMDTEAVLIAGVGDSAQGGFKHPEHGPLATLITNRIAGVLAAQKYVVCTYNIPEPLLPKAIKITPGLRGPTISPLADTNREKWVAVSVMVEKKQAAKAMDELMEVGAHDILITKLENCRV